MRQHLRFLDPGPPEPFQRLDVLVVGILQAREDDRPVARRLDQLLEHLEPVRFAQTQLLELGLQQPLGRILQRLLHLANAHRQHPRLVQAVLDQKLGKEMRLARPAPAIRALVARRLQQRQEHPRRFNPKCAARC